MITVHRTRVILVKIAVFFVHLRAAINMSLAYRGKDMGEFWKCFIVEKTAKRESFLAWPVRLRRWYCARVSKLC